MKTLLLLAAVLGALLSGCAGISTSIEACIIDPVYGKICASYVDKKITIRAEGQIPPELRDRIEDYMKKLAGEK